MIFVPVSGQQIIQETVFANVPVPSQTQIAAVTVLDTRPVVWVPGEVSVTAHVPRYHDWFYLR